MESIIKKLGKASITVEKDYHSSEKEYNKLTVVEEKGAFKTYLSRKPVPVGIKLTNREYWIPFSGVLESITLDYLKFKQDYGSGNALEDDSIITRHILDRNITGNKIATQSISTEHLINDIINTNIIKDRAVTTEKIDDNSISSNKLIDNSVITEKIVNDAITTEKVKNNSIISSKLSTDIQFIINNLNKTATFAGIATPTTNPGVPTAKTFYITNDKGIYNNFDGIEVTDGEIAILYFDTTWHKKTTGIASKETLTELKEKVDSLALGTFYGFFPDSSSLPIDITTSGYAYVGLDTPYKIWNFNGESWSDSRTVIDMNDADEEDITRNVDGKLQFKNKEYGDGMGYIILRKNKSFAEQVTKENTIYEIRYDFDLNGAEVTIPEGCVLKFEGGSFNNGKILFNNTYLINNIKINCSFDGHIKNDILQIKWFGKDNNIDFDNGPILQNLCINAAKYGNRKVFINDGVWYINTSVNLPDENFYGNIELFGNKKTSILKAGKKIKYILGTESKSYFTHRIYNLVLDGNRDQPYYVNDNFIESDESSLADYGIYNTYGYIYSYIDHVIFRSFNKWGIYITGGSWGLYINKCECSSSGGGICINATSNGNVITNCEFKLIKYIGLFCNVTYNVTITSNIFEIIGGGALVVSSYDVGGSFINSNYFEITTKNGLIINSGYTEYPLEPIAVHSNIFVGRYSLNNDFSLTLTAFCIKGVSITNNTFQVDNQQESCIFGGVISNSEIKHNVANKQCNLISFLWKHPFSKFTNINISYNTSIDNKLLNKFNYLLKDVSSYYASRIFTNIYSEDPLSSNIYKDNVLNHSILSFSGKLEETGEYYNGEKVFLCKEGGQFFIWGNYSEINATIPYWNEMYNNKIIDFKYNIKTESYDWYETGVTIELKNDTHEYQGLYISKNSKITLPIAYVIGEGDFRKESYNFKLYSSPGKYIYNVPGFTLKQNTITLIEGNDIFEGIDGNNKKLLKKSIYHGEIEDLNIPYDIRSIFKGVTVYSETNKNVLIYDGNSRWLSVNGDTPNAKGSESNKQNVIKKQNTLYYNTDTKKLEYYNGENFEAIQSSSKGLFDDKPINPQIGFAYFCTDKQTSEGSTNGIMIYHKGNDIWVDALGRIVE